MHYKTLLLSLGIILKLKKMPTIKKPSKSKVKLDTFKELDKAVFALNNGAKLVHDNIFGYGVEYPTGGYFKITKTIYDKLKN